MSKRTLLPASILVLALGAAACGGAGAAATPAASQDGGGSPTGASDSPAPGGIVHPTGATDVVFRFDEAGGLMFPEFAAAHVPYFTLYGDGRVVFVSTEPFVESQPNQPMLGQPVRTTKLSDAEMQDFLLFALKDGGLANARERYDNPMIADAPTAVFQVNADGDSKTVSVMALGFEDQPGPDSAIKARLAKLGALLRDFDQGDSVASEPYAPTGYRGVLFEQPGAQGVNARPWPWPSLEPADFAAPADPNVIQLRTRNLTPDEAAAVGVEGYQNGVQGGLYYQADGTLYSFVLRPLLPDEAS